MRGPDRCSHVALLTLVAALAGCAAGHESGNGYQLDRNDSLVLAERERPGPDTFVGRAGPGEARIVGRITAVDQARYGLTPDDPCSRAPCRATIVVDSVAAVGSDFPLDPRAGDNLIVTFALTLAPTNDTYNGMTISYPGLDVGSRFEAELRYEPSSASDGDAAENGSLTIYGYRRR